MTWRDILSQNGTEEPRFLVGAAKDSHRKHYQGCQGKRHEITAIEPAQVALERAVTPAAPVSDACVYIYAGKIRSVIIFSWKGNGIFYRTMSIGFTGISFVDESFNEQLSAEYSAFAREIHSSLQFALSQIRDSSRTYSFSLVPGRLRISANSLKESLSIPEIMSPTQFGTASVDSSAGSWDIPIGLALR